MSEKSYVLTTALIILMFCINTGADAPRELQLSGQIVDCTSGDPIYRAIVRLDSLSHFTTTDKDGSFSLTIPAQGATFVIIDKLGYKAVKHSVSHIRQLNGLVTLCPEPLILPEITVRASRLTDPHQLHRFDPDARFIDRSDLDTTPVFEAPDVMRSLQTLAGVMPANEADPRLSIKGGRVDQNLILLDGAVLYYPYHSMGTVSALPTDVIGSVQLTPGGFSAAYGDRLSSVIDMKSRDPEKANFSTRADINIAQGSLTASTRPSDRWGVLLSARTNFSDMNSFIPDDFGFSFYDFYGKTDLILSKSLELELFALLTSDLQTFRTDSKMHLNSTTDEDTLTCNRVYERDLGHGSGVVSLAATFTPHPDLVSSLQIYQSRALASFAIRQKLESPETIAPRFKPALDQAQQYIRQWNQKEGADIANTLTDYTIKGELLWMTGKTTLSTGFSLSRIDFDYGWERRPEFSPYVRLFFDHAPNEAFLYQDNLSRSAAFAELAGNPVPAVHYRSGIRITYRSSGSISVDPRLNLSIDLGQDTQIQGAVGRFSQGMNTALERGLVGFLPLYFPVTEPVLPRAWHMLVSLKNRPQTGFGFAMTGYIKRFSNLPMSRGPEPSFTYHTGMARGLGFELYYAGHDLTASLSYTLSHSYRNTQSGRIDFPTDHRHVLKAHTVYRWGSLSLSVAGRFNTGQPYDPGSFNGFYIRPGYNYFHGNDWISHYGTVQIDVPHSVIRYPSYHRLDLSLRYDRATILGIDISPYLSIYNVYSRPNVLYYTDLRIEGREGEGLYQNPRMVRDAFSVLITPTVGVQVEF
jgi:hypothetical protein